MNEETKRNLIWAISITLMVLGFFAFLSILSFPAKWTIEIQMDNNTREAIQSINYTGIMQSQCQDWEKDIEYYCDDINNDGLTLADCVRNKCYALDKHEVKNV